MGEQATGSEAAATPPQSRRRVVVLAGPSGAGKSRLAERLHAARGWPVFRLDDFYRDEDDPAAPRHPDLGIVDWDHPGSWDADRAMDALRHLLDSGECVTPVYDIAQSRAVDTRTLTARPDDLVLAEGIFAAEVVRMLEAEGMLHSAWCVHHHPAVVFVRRLVRDLRERRKPPAVLVRRGWRLMRDQPGTVARQTALGASVSRPSAIEGVLLG
ncbi:ATP-binding protein [Phycicoccus sp. CSK15P-2]|uniref:uridine kinase family protein n=1 Tax=Phycicoccus sp. CSK15P-2 TaxID=2807627 RepID=UPI00194DF20F|nr:ATP-binding protein [Phycicoccus sp. CSK15P-2]MBM6402900.1 ATP-binding protein [Phycicoccus sp. CSK15P-2]